MDCKDFNLIKKRKKVHVLSSRKENLKLLISNHWGGLHNMNVSYQWPFNFDQNVCTKVV